MARAKKEDILDSDTPFDQRIRKVLHLTPWIRRRLNSQIPSPDLFLDRHLKELWADYKPGKK